MNWSALCLTWSLCDIISPPEPVSGGYMHRMFRVYTSAGQYAVKLLNPGVMARPEALGNYAEAEALERLVQRAGIPILPAKELGGAKLNRQDGQYYYLFDWFDGRALPPEAVTPKHAALMGRELARIHLISEREAGASEAYRAPDWNHYLDLLRGTDEELYRAMDENARLLAELSRSAETASNSNPVQVVCHNDMDRKNVLWRGDEYRIIDLECLSYGDAENELVETALCWSGVEELHIDAARLRGFLSAYTAEGGHMPRDPASALCGNTSRLDWLEYSLKRALCIDAGADEKQLGREQALGALEQLRHIHENRSMILEAFK